MKSYPDTTCIHLTLSIKEARKIYDALMWNVVHSEATLSHAENERAPFYSSEYEHDCFTRLEDAYTARYLFSELYEEATKSLWGKLGVFDDYESLCLVQYSVHNEGTEQEITEEIA